MKPVVFIILFFILPLSWDVYNHFAAEALLNKVAKFAPKYGMTEDTFKEVIHSAQDGCPETEAEVKALIKEIRLTD